ncbi:MAG: 2-keto-4-pentenoate hydratase [Frankiales bacterium]|jgi:2-keto-4-pentenoate hydratase|nr:2-keto-4-pentenoate hydratase [Frankiales bacterium]
MTADLEARVAEATQRLRAAADSRVPCEPVRGLLEPGGVSAAYRVQHRLAAAGVAAGRVRVGHKIGLTSLAVQRQLGVDQPDFGVLFADMQVRSGGVVDTARLLQPRIEAEIVFVLADDLPSTGTTASDVRRATSHLLAGLEIVDSRIADWDITILDTIADNASCGMFVVGTAATPPAFDLTGVEMTMRHGADEVSSGTGAACLGDPVEAVAWLARTAASLGDPLRAGDLVLSGALGPMVPVSPGDAFTASFAGLGDVSVRFSTPGEDDR